MMRGPVDLKREREEGRQRALWVALGAGLGAGLGLIIVDLVEMVATCLVKP